MLSCAAGSIIESPAQVVDMACSEPGRLVGLTEVRLLLFSLLIDFSSSKFTAFTVNRLVRVAIGEALRFHVR